MKALLEFTNIVMVPAVTSPLLPVTEKFPVAAGVNVAATVQGVFSVSVVNPVSDPVISTVPVFCVTPVPVEVFVTTKFVKLLSVSQQPEAVPTGVNVESTAFVEQDALAAHAQFADISNAPATTTFEPIPNLKKICFI
jgi:hypothetical protein